MLLSDMSGRCPLYRKYVEPRFQFTAGMSFAEASYETDFDIHVKGFTFNF